MREVNLFMKLVEVKAGNRNNLLEALSEIGSFDNDFNGENGIEYLWEEADGFESNLEYLINEVKDIKDDEECVTNFIEEWMNHDINYYDRYELDLIKDSKKRVTAIAFSAAYGY